MCFYCYYSPKNEVREGKGELLKFGFKCVVFFLLDLLVSFVFIQLFAETVHVRKSTTASPIFLFSFGYDEMDNSNLFQDT